MYKIKKILVGLDTSEIDETLIKYASFIARSTVAMEIQFVNVIKNMQVPQEVLKDFPDLVDNAINERKKQLQEEVDRFFDYKENINVKIKVLQGYPAKKLIKEAHDKGVDLIVVGRKNTLKGTGVRTHRLARRASCSVLFIPEGFQPDRLDKILVPSDFSSSSKKALEQAIHIAHRNQTPEHQINVVCQNVYTVPVGYHYTGKSYEDFAKVMEKNSEKHYNKFIKGIDKKDVKVTPVYSLDDNDDPVEDIYDMANEQDADLIVIGAKGQTATAAIFIGSMAERLIKYNFTQPLLMVRRKGKNAGLFDYLKEI